MTIRSAWKAQTALLLIKKIIVSAKYLDFANMFLKKFAQELLIKQTSINEHFIKLIKGK